MLCPIGKYDGTFCALTMGETAAQIHKKVLFKATETVIPYSDIANVSFHKASMMGTGFLCIRSRSSCMLPLATTSNAATDTTTLVFGAVQNEKMFAAYQYLSVCAQENNITCPAISEADIPSEAQACAEIPSAAVPDENGDTEDFEEADEHGDTEGLEGLDEYYERFYPNRINAIKALSRERGMELVAAKQCIDTLFNAKQNETCREDPSAALKELRRCLNPKKVAFQEEKERLESNGIAYCPKCHSTSITAGQKGFSAGKAAIGALAGIDAALVAGSVGAKKVRCTCLKCGYQWYPGKK